MTFLYIQTIKSGKNKPVPYCLAIQDGDLDSFYTFNFRPEITISKRVYEHNNLDWKVHSSAPLFCDIADELIELLQHKQLVFAEFNQFMLLQSQFKMVGYNFNTQPKYVWHTLPKNNKNSKELELCLPPSPNLSGNSETYAEAFLQLMHKSFFSTTPRNLSQQVVKNVSLNLDFSEYSTAAGVYYFFDASGTIIYVGKAKNVRKRLQSHFNGFTNSKTIDYSKITAVTVEYTGSDIIAQLLESAQIKTLKPLYNSQQVNDAAPFIINKSKTAKGINKLQITRKDIADNRPEIYFNRRSVKKVLLQLATEFGLCKKHCGLERIKGPCSNVTLRHQNCVCANTEAIAKYNERFEVALFEFSTRKSGGIYKLKGRHINEDAFVYLLNDIYEGYGFIGKNETVTNENDILGHLIPQKNNYDTSRILEHLSKTVTLENILNC
ncbi:nucleotide excision repair endonuclease [Bizionia gelidisalsuginis]|uniref:Excinuclease cho n=1 Tax=Bizionia gelidisalsuginis TaxID=291188 RepID=A0ABY3M7T9_9FLAO|nr:GIY-YIG nuclease family protein [Bizionia gelidisalsuginis]TYC09582.1 nucleotide excision repair endonuclease [Bizionia gelidisalsuginis]